MNEGTDRHHASADDLPEKQIFHQAVQSYIEPATVKLNLLEECGEDIAALRAKGVSIREITRVLNESGIIVSRFTVGRFCRGLKKGRSTPSPKPKPVPIVEKPTPPPSEPTTPLPSVISAATAEFRPKRRGPRIADPRNI